MRIRGYTATCTLAYCYEILFFWRNQTCGQAAIYFAHCRCLTHRPTLREKSFPSYAATVSISTLKLLTYPLEIRIRVLGQENIVSLVLCALHHTFDEALPKLNVTLSSNATARCETGTDVTGYSCISSSGMAAVAWFASFLLISEACLLAALVLWKDDLFFVER